MLQHCTRRRLPRDCATCPVAVSHRVEMSSRLLAFVDPYQTRVRDQVSCDPLQRLPSPCCGSRHRARYLLGCESQVRPVHREVGCSHRKALERRDLGRCQLRAVEGAASTLDAWGSDTLAACSESNCCPEQLCVSGICFPLSPFCLGPVCGNPADESVENPHLLYISSCSIWSETSTVLHDEVLPQLSCKGCR